MQTPSGGDSVALGIAPPPSPSTFYDLICRECLSGDDSSVQKMWRGSTFSLQLAVCRSLGDLNVEKASP